MGDQRFPSEAKLRRQADFERVYQRGVSAADRLLVVRACENGLPYARLGLAVSRKVGNAVCRNRWRRVMREAFRQSRDRLPAGVDLVLHPRRGAEPDFHGLLESLPRLARRLTKRLDLRPTAEPNRSGKTASHQREIQ